MENEIKPLEANPEGSELKPAEGTEDVSKAKDLEAGAQPSEELTLEEINKITGREFKNREEFEKHYKELSSFVGQNPQELKEKAEAFDKMIEDANKIVDEAESTGELEKIEVPSEIEEVKRKIEEMELSKSYPEAEKVKETIYSIAQAEGISLKEAYEKHLKDLVTSKLEVEKSKAEEITGIESKSRIAPGESAEISQLIDKVQKTDSLEAKQKLVEKILGLSK